MMNSKGSLNPTIVKQEIEIMKKEIEYGRKC